MAINKNFVVKNGLEVNTDLIFADSASGKVGIGSTLPTVELDVQGAIAATDVVSSLLRVTGYSTLSQVTVNNDITVLGFSTLTNELNVLGISSLSNLRVVGVATFENDVNFDSNVDVDGHAELDDLNVSGVSTFVGFSTFNDYVTIQDGLNVLGITTLGTVQVSSGIITSTSGIVTYYGNGVYLDNAGTLVTNILYVTQDGNDTNTGQKLGDAKRTIGGALSEATTGTVIKVSAGSYLENNPLVIPEQVSIVGDSLREVSVSPQNPGEDLFYVSNGNYIAEMSYTGTLNSGKAIFAFNPNQIGYFNQSPYIQNCTNFIPNSIGLKIDGLKAIGPLKSMVLDSYTQYNQGGIGCSITNEGYAQLVSLFTICNETAIYCGSGAACDLTNSNSSFGDYGLVADGVGPLKYTGIITSAGSANDFEFVLDLNVPTLNVTNALYDNTTGLTTITVSSNHNFNVGMGVSIVGLAFTCPSGPGIVTYPSGNKGYIFEVQGVPSSTSFEVYVGVSTLQHTYDSGGTVKINVVRPFDGQVVYFDTLYYTIGGVTVSSGGTGYTQNVDITFDSPGESWGIPATAVGEVKNGSVTKVEMVSNGRGYTSPPTVTFASPSVGINTATGTANLVPTYYVIESSTPISAGICTITLTDNVPYAVGLGSTVSFFKQSRVLASGHSLEYIGSGINIATALPQNGGIPIQENETDSKNGGLVVFTSTDQSGNFRIGDGVVINQQTGTISGTFYSKSLFSTMTPFILALGGD